MRTRISPVDNNTFEVAGLSRAESREWIPRRWRNNKIGVKTRANVGFILVEVLLAAAILGVILVPTLNLLITGTESTWFASQEVKGQTLLREGVEGVRSVRQRNWRELSDGTFYASPSAGNWKLYATASAETVGQYNRKIEIAPVNRNASGAIVDTGGTPDPSTKKMTVTVSWHSLRDRVLTFSSYLTRYLDNEVWKQTTKAEFDLGTKDMTKTQSGTGDDGSVILMGGCPSSSPESLIYDDQLRNGWRTSCSGLPFWDWLKCILLSIWNIISNNGNTIKVDNTSPTYNGSSKSIKLVLNPGGLWSYEGIYNYNGVCTIGFKNLHFYAYNPSAQPITLYVTAEYGSFNRKQAVLPPGGWTEVTLDYQGLVGGYETSLQTIYFSVSSPTSPTTLYIDQMELTGGVGGYFDKGTLTSSVFDATRETAFNRISYNAVTSLGQTSVGFQIATSNNSGGPWNFKGPGGTSSESDLYNVAAGSGIWLGNNLGRYCRYKAYLFSYNGTSTPTLKDVSVNYAP